MADKKKKWTRKGNAAKEAARRNNTKDGRKWTSEPKPEPKDN